MYNSRLSFTYNKKIKNICIYFYIHKKTQKAILKTNNNVFTWVYVCVRGWGRRVLGWMEDMNESKMYVCVYTYMYIIFEHVNVLLIQ